MPRTPSVSAGRRLVDHARCRRRCSSRRRPRVLGDPAQRRQAAGLLLALHQHPHVQRQRARLRELAGHVQQRIEVALVVAGPAGVQALAPDRRLERRRRPLVDGVRRLDVVVAVDEHRRRVLAARAQLAHHQRVARLVADDLGRPPGGLRSSSGTHSAARSMSAGSPPPDEIEGIFRSSVSSSSRAPSASDTAILQACRRRSSAATSSWTGPILQSTRGAPPPPRLSLRHERARERRRGAGVRGPAGPERGAGGARLRAAAGAADRRVVVGPRGAGAARPGGAGGRRRPRPGAGRGGRLVPAGGRARRLPAVARRGLRLGPRPGAAPGRRALTGPRPAGPRRARGRLVRRPRSSASRAPDRRPQPVRLSLGDTIERDDLWPSSSRPATSGSTRSPIAARSRPAATSSTSSRRPVRTRCASSSSATRSSACRGSRSSPSAR